MGLLFTTFFVVSRMDVLAEEFGNLTPEQLAAPIPTVEVKAGQTGNGRGWDASPGGGTVRAPAAERGGSWLLRMLGTSRTVFLRTRLGGSFSRAGRASGWEAASLSAVARAELSGWTLSSVHERGQDWSSRPSLRDTFHLLRLVEDAEAQGALGPFREVPQLAVVIKKIVSMSG